MSDEKRVVALIPVREGSQRVKNKNFRKFADYESLLHLKITQLKEADCFDEIYVSSDSALAKDIANDLGVEFLVRSEYMCGHDARLYEYNNYMLNTVPGDPIVAWTMVTAPLFNAYGKAVDAFLSHDRDEYDSLLSVVPFNDFLIDVNGKPINCAFGHWHLLTQELRESYMITGGVYMARKSDQLKWSYWFGPKPNLFEISKVESIDVDDQEDFRIAEVLHTNYS